MEIITSVNEPLCMTLGGDLRHTHQRPGIIETFFPSLFGLGQGYLVPRLFIRKPDTALTIKFVYSMIFFP